MKVKKEASPIKLNHINLTVTDVNATKEFLEKYFDLKTKSIHGDSFAVLLDEDGLLLALTKGTKVDYPKSFHIGFEQESMDQVNKINQRLKEDGLNVKPPKQLHRYTFYVKAPGGFLVEVFY